MEKIRTIALPTRPQPDTIVAIFLLKTFGKEKFPGIADAGIEVRSSLKEGENFDSLLTEGVLALDMAGGPFDHHGKTLCATELVVEALNLKSKRELEKLITFSCRDDKEGKGTLSTDGIDRALGLPGLIASLNKVYPGDPNTIVETVLPLLDAHYKASLEHHVTLPKEVANMKKEGAYKEVHAKQGKKNLLVALVHSDKPAMTTFLRSKQGPHVDVVVQKSTTGHVAILTKRERNLTIAGVAGFIRLREAQIRNTKLSSEDSQYLSQTGVVEEVPMWYYDPATNSLLNGGAQKMDIEPTKIPEEELLKIVVAGLAH